MGDLVGPGRKNQVVGVIVSEVAGLAKNGLLAIVVFGRVVGSRSAIVVVGHQSQAARYHLACGRRRVLLRLVGHNKNDNIKA